MQIKHSIFLGLGAIALLSGTARAESIPSAPIVPVGDVVSTEEDDALRMTVPVMVNGQGPFQFVIDTGADRTVISSELAERLGLADAGKARLHAMGGERDVRIVAIDSVQVSTNTVRDVRAAALPARNLGADGLLGIDSLKGQRIIMDFKAQTMTVVPSSKNDAKSADDEGMIVVTAKTRLGQLVMVDAAANGQKVWVVVDTGAENSVGNSRLKQLMIKRNSKLPVKTVEMSDVLGKRTPAEYIIVDKMRVGDIAMTNSPIAFADAHPFKLFDLTTKPAMLLGMEGLRSFDRVSVDFTSRKIKFLLPKADTQLD
jgi:predicted aspartyl protease